MPKTYNLDHAITENRPMVIIRGTPLLIADLPARKALIYQRKMQAAQTEIERQDMELESEIQAAREEGEPLDPDKVAERREEIAEQMQDVLSQSVRLMLERPVENEDWEEGDPEDERWVTDEQGRIETEEIPDEIADTISMEEFRLINHVVEKTDNTPIQLEPVEEGKGN